MNLLRKYSFPIISSIFLTIMPIICSSILGFLVISDEKIIENFGVFHWVFITIICCFTSIIAISPPTFLALIFGYFLGWKAILPLFSLNMIAIFLVNQLTRWIDKDSFRNYISENEKVRIILENIKKDELKLIFLTKLSPVLPFALMNFVFALSGAKLRNILLGGFLGMIPRTILAIWTGSETNEIRKLIENPNESNFSQIMIILLIISSVGGIFYLISEKINIFYKKKNVS